MGITANYDSSISIEKSKSISFKKIYSLSSSHQNNMGSVPSPPTTDFISLLFKEKLVKFSIKDFSVFFFSKELKVFIIQIVWGYNCSH